jgi:cell division topological specificity factor
MNVFSRLLKGNQQTSRDIAKDRLQLVLVQDRVHLAPEVMHELKDELIQLISKYVEIDRDGIDITLTKAGRRSRLTADIPVIGMHQK